MFVPPSFCTQGPDCRVLVVELVLVLAIAPTWRCINRCGMLTATNRRSMLAWHGGFGGMAQNQAHPISTTNISRGIRDHFAPYAPLVMEFSGNSCYCSHACVLPQSLGTCIITLSGLKYALSPAFSMCLLPHEQLCSAPSCSEICKEYQCHR